MDVKETKPLTKCLTCGAGSEDLHRIWPDPEHLPQPRLKAWNVDWKARSRPDLEKCCVACATVISVYFDAVRHCIKWYGRLLHIYLVHRVATRSGRRLLALNPVHPSDDGQGYKASIVFQPFVNTSSGEQFEPCDSFIRNSASPEAFERVREWFDTCRANHPKCSIAPESYVPARLVDIGLDAERENPRLVLRHEIQSDVPFVALSYCWGGSQPLQTRKQNIEWHTAGIPLEDFPATFKDAIKVMRALSLRYIWIDSLCIIQDDKADMERETAQMEKIYGGAELVLAAAVSTSARDGFLRDREPTHTYVGRVSFTLDAKAGPVETEYSLRTEIADKEISHLRSRAWAFQERLLARRYLVYGKHEMRWQCREDNLCECIFPLKTDSWDFNLANKLEETAPLGSMDVWREYILTEYGGRQLTVHSDKLIALSGVASRFQQTYNCGTYLAGIWKQDLAYGLTWDAEEGMPENFPAPSWSWISVHSPSIATQSVAGREMRDTDTLVDILDASVTPTTPNPFGPVSSGLIRLRGKTVEATLRLQNSKGWGVSVNDGDEGTYTHSTQLDMPLTAYATSDHEVTRRQQPVSSARRISHTEDVPPSFVSIVATVWLVPILSAELLWSKGRPTGFYVRALILGPSPGKLGCFARLGVLTIRVDDVAGFLARYETRAISLV